jgi:hypothetical protein
MRLNGAIIVIFATRTLNMQEEKDNSQEAARKV